MINILLLFFISSLYARKLTTKELTESFIFPDVVNSYTCDDLIVFINILIGIISK